MCLGINLAIRNIITQSWLKLRNRVPVRMILTIKKRSKYQAIIVNENCMLLRKDVRKVAFITPFISFSQL